MTVEDIIEIASRKYPKIKEAHTGHSNDPLALWLLDAIKAAYKPGGKDFEQVTRCADGIHKQANLVYDIWSHLIDYADDSAEGKPKNYEKIGA